MSHSCEVQCGMGGPSPSREVTSKGRLDEASGTLLTQPGSVKGHFLSMFDGQNWLHGSNLPARQAG